MRGVEVRECNVGALAAIERDGLVPSRCGKENAQKQRPHHLSLLALANAQLRDTFERSRLPPPFNRGRRSGAGGDGSAVAGNTSRSSGNWNSAPVKMRPLPSSTQPDSPRARKEVFDCLIRRDQAAGRIVAIPVHHARRGVRDGDHIAIAIEMVKNMACRPR